MEKRFNPETGELEDLNTTSSRRDYPPIREQQRSSPAPASSRHIEQQSNVFLQVVFIAVGLVVILSIIGSIIKSQPSRRSPESPQQQYGYATSGKIGGSIKDNVTSGLEGNDRDSENRAIVTFLKKHHAYASSGNIEDLIKDYASNVNYNRQWINSSQIKSDEVEYHKKWRQVIEVISTPVQISKNGSVWQAAYTIDFRTDGQSGNWVTGKCDVLLTLIRDTTHYKIQSQTVRVYNQATGVKPMGKAIGHGQAPSVKSPKSSSRFNDINHY